MTNCEKGWEGRAQVAVRRKRGGEEASLIGWSGKASLRKGHKLRGNRRGGMDRSEEGLGGRPRILGTRNQGEL